MPKIFGHLPDDDVWKMIAYVRSICQGDPAKTDWSGPWFLVRGGRR
jgi:hypothetical protein